MKPKKGLIHVYTGEGKGKTTVSLGLAMRALGHGFKVHLIQFLKGGGHLGEVEFSKSVDNFTVEQYGRKCPYSREMKKGTIDCGNCRDCFLTRKQEGRQAKKGVEAAKKAVSSGIYELVILDEANVAVSSGLISLKEMLEVLELKSEDTELVLTGRNAPKKLLEKADYATNLSEIKHPFTSGYRVRRGIDY